MVKIDEVREAIKELAKAKSEKERKEYIVIHYSELAKYLNITPVYALTWLRSICEEFGRYNNGRCVIYSEDVKSD
jgi:MFS superfamily sulfate permease-like transporter